MDDPFKVTYFNTQYINCDIIYLFKIIMINYFLLYNISHKFYSNMSL